MLKVKDYFKKLFDYKKRFKHQKNNNKRLRRKIVKLQTNLATELRLDVTNDEIAKLRKIIEKQNKELKKLNYECQKYFELWFEKVNQIEKESDE